MLIIFQLALYCFLFTAMVRYAVKGGAIDGLYFYPKPVQERAIEIGLTDRETMQHKRKVFMKEFFIVMLAALVLIIGLWNRVSDFKTVYLPGLIVQFKAFAIGYTPYPKYAKWFNLFVGMVPALVISLIVGPHTALGARIGTMFLSTGNAFTFGGLLIAPNFVEHKGTLGSRIWSGILTLAGVRFEHQWSAQEHLIL